VDKTKEVFSQQNGPARTSSVRLALADTGHVRAKLEWMLKPEAGTQDPLWISNIRQPHLKLKLHHHHHQDVFQSPRSRLECFLQLCHQR
jgi:hypothetical protein